MKKPSAPHFPDLDEKREAVARTERLKAAVRAGGGTIKEVANLAGVKFGTLQGYLAGGEMKFTNVAALAEAADFSLDWLATGRGAMRPSTSAASSPTSPEPQKTAPPAPFGDLDVDRLQAALAAALQALPAGRRPEVDTRRFAQLLALLYAELSEIKP